MTRRATVLVTAAALLGVAYAASYLSGSLWSSVAGRVVDRGGTPPPAVHRPFTVAP